MALVGIDINETIQYSLKGDKENPTIFHIGVMKQSDKMRIIKSAVSGNEVDATKLQDQYMDILKGGLKKIENIIIKGESKTIEKIDDDVLDLFTMEQLVEVAGKIMEFNFLSENEQKN